MNKWYKFLSEAVEKKSLQEITKYQLENTKLEKYLKNKDSDQLEAIFEGKKRIAIPFESDGANLSRTDRQLLDYIKQLRQEINFHLLWFSNEKFTNYNNYKYDNTKILCVQVFYSVK